MLSLDVDKVSVRTAKSPVEKHLNTLKTAADIMATYMYTVQIHIHTNAINAYLRRIISIINSAQCYKCVPAT